MKKNKKKQEKSKLIADNSKLTIKLDKDEIKQNWKKAVNKLKKNIKVDGFRTGKAPTKLAEKKIGQQKIINQVLQLLLPSKYEKIIKKNKKKPITRPKFIPLKLDKGEDWEIEAQFAEKPELDISEYKKIVKKAKKTAENKIKELEQKIKKQANKKSQKANSKTEKSKKKAKVKEDQSKKTMSDHQKRDVTLQTIFQALINEIKPAIPELLLEEETQREWKNLSNSLTQVKMKLEDYLARRQMKAEELTQELAAKSLGRLQLDFILGAITDKEKIEAKDEDVKKKLNEIKDEKIKKQVQSNNRYIAQLKEIVKREKTLANIESI